MNYQKEKTLINYKKVQSLMTKIIKMVDEDRYCIDIMQQSLAAIGLLKSAHRMLMEGHLNSCFKKAIQTHNQRRMKQMIEEILRVNHLVSKS